MPELPEVETIKNTLKLNEGYKLKDIVINRLSVIKRQDFKYEKACGKQIASVWRRGKYLIIGLVDELNIVFHLGMSGRLYMLEEKEPINDSHVHAVLYLDNDRKLVYQDARRFGGIWFITDPDGFFQHMGKEPLGEEFTPAYLEGVFKNRKAAVKTLLLNQSLVAGLGNIYTDEALFAARIRPDRPAGSLNLKEIKRLQQAIRKILTESISQRGTTFRDFRDGYNQAGNFQNYLKVYGRTDEKCPRCGTKLEKTIIGGRSSHFCKKCQN